MDADRGFKSSDPGRPCPPIPLWSGHERHLLSSVHMSDFVGSSPRTVVTESQLDLPVSLAPSEVLSSQTALSWMIRYDSSGRHRIGLG